MNMATQEKAVAPPLGIDPEIKEEEEDQGLMAFNEDADDELPPGWLVISDGEQLIIPHPEDKTKEEIVDSFFAVKKKKQGAFRIGLYVFEVEDITTFGWSEDIHFPEIEKFDGIQERLEALLEATAELTQVQAQLQAAQAQLFTSEQFVDEGTESIASIPAPPAPSLAGPPRTQEAAVQAGKRRGFRPPGA